MTRDEQYALLRVETAAREARREAGVRIRKGGAK